MLKEGRVIGGITIYRPEVGLFTQKQIDLVSIFRRPGCDRNRECPALRNADQGSPRAADGDRRDPARHQQIAHRHPAGVRRGGRKRRAPLAVNDIVIRLVDANMHRAVAHYGPIPAPASSSYCTWSYRRPLNPRRPAIHVPDVLAAHVREEYPEMSQLQAGIVPLLAVPLVREDMAIGVIDMRRLEFVRSLTNRSSSSRPSPPGSDRDRERAAVRGS